VTVKPSRDRGPMNARACALWCASALAVSLSAGNPLYRALVILVALNVLFSLKRPDVRLGPLLTALAVAGFTATALTVLVSHTGRHVLATLPEAIPAIGGALTAEALAFGVASGLGIAAAVLCVAPLSQVLEAHEVVDALPRATARVGAALGTALNLIPGVGRSAREIRDAQRMRGWEPKRLRGWSEVAVPVMLTAVEDSVRLAEAMEARGYGAGHRTHYAIPRWRAADIAVAAMSVAAATAFVALRATGENSDWFPFPDLTVPQVSVIGVLACLVLMAPAVIWRR